MRLKYCLTIFLMIGLISLSYSQKKSSKYDSRLLTKYTSEYLESLQAEDLDYLNFIVDNSYYLMDAQTVKQINTVALVRVDPQTKAETPITSLDEIQNNFNPYLYNCEIGAANQTYYTIGSTGMILVMRSKASLDMKYRSYKTEINQINNK